MVQVRFIQHDGTENVVEGNEGDSVMQTARDNMVPGIIGDCGGNCSCATCHGYVDADWLAKLEPVGENEEIMLDGVMNQEKNSRLTCQIKLKRELNGLVIRLPISQV
ncbi:MAG: 2Fe-2S iron-sulfur cluster-binding protein [Polyangiales bacterium]